MDAIKDPADEVAARFLADLRAKTTRTADQRADPAWHAMALAAFDLFEPSAWEAIIMASRLAAQSPAEIAADRAEIAEVIKSLGDSVPSPA
jgi:hypothetical protein